jgi:hypothetical protein
MADPYPGIARVLFLWVRSGYGRGVGRGRSETRFSKAQSLVTGDSFERIITGTHLLSQNNIPGFFRRDLSARDSRRKTVRAHSGVSKVGVASFIPCYILPRITYFLGCFTEKLPSSVHLSTFRKSSADILLIAPLRGLEVGQESNELSVCEFDENVWASKIYNCSPGRMIRAERGILHEILGWMELTPEKWRFISGDICSSWNVLFWFLAIY